MHPSKTVSSCMLAIVALALLTAGAAGAPGNGALDARVVQASVPLTAEIVEPALNDVLRIAALYGAVPDALEPHAPILIDGDEDLCDPVVGGLLSGVRNCSTGDGSVQNPYEISGWLIGGLAVAGGSSQGLVVDGLPTTLKVRHTEAHLVIRDNVVVGSYRSGWVAWVEEASQVRFEDNTVGGMRPLNILNTDGTHVARNVLVKSVVGAGVFAFDASGGAFMDNVIVPIAPPSSFSPGFEVYGTDNAFERNHVEGSNPAYGFGGHWALQDLPRTLAAFGETNSADACRVIVLRGLGGDTLDARRGEVCPLALLDSHDVRLENFSFSTGTFTIWRSTRVTMSNASFSGLDLGICPCRPPGTAEDAALSIHASSDVLVDTCDVDRGLNEGVAVTDSSDVTLAHCSWAADADVTSVALRLLWAKGSRNVTVTGAHLEDYVERAILLEDMDGFELRDTTAIGPSGVPALSPIFDQLNDLLGATDFQSGILWDFGSRNTRVVDTTVACTGSELDGWHSFIHIRASGAAHESNHIEGCNGTALRFLASSGLATRNVLADNEVALEAGPSAGVPSSVVARLNDVEGNDVGLRGAGENGSVDARSNWWGSPDGPGGDGPGTGDAFESTGGSVAIEPFLAEPANV